MSVENLTYNNRRERERERAKNKNREKWECMSIETTGKKSPILTVREKKVTQKTKVVENSST